MQWLVAREKDFNSLQNILIVLHYSIYHNLEMHILPQKGRILAPNFPSFLTNQTTLIKAYYHNCEAN